MERWIARWMEAFAVIFCANLFSEIQQLPVATSRYKGKPVKAHMDVAMSAIHHDCFSREGGQFGIFHNQ